MKRIVLAIGFILAPVIISAAHRFHTWVQVNAAIVKLSETEYMEKTWLTCACGDKKTVEKKIRILLR